MAFDPFAHAFSLEGTPIAPPVVFFRDFLTAGYVVNATESAMFSETANRGEWLVTVTDTGGDNGEVIRIADAEPGGVLRLTTNDADDDLLGLQLNGEAFAITNDKPITFAIRMKGTDVSEFDWFVGLAGTDTSILAGTNDSIGFRCPDSTGDIDALTEDDTTETVTDTTSDLADDTFVTLAFQLSVSTDNTRWCKFYVDSVIKATHKTNIPDAATALTPTIEFRNDGAAANTLEIDWIYVRQER